MTVFEFDDYRKFLKAALAERMIRNPSYSLRAFAKGLGVSSSGLSEVLSGKTNLSSDLAERIGNHLQLARDELDYFFLLVLYSQTKSQDLKNTLMGRMNAFTLNSGLNPSLELFRCVADWYSVAILTFSDKSNSEILTQNSNIEIDAVAIEQGRKKIMELHKLLSALCLLVPMVSDAGIKNDVLTDLSGTYQCPEYNKPDNSWKAHKIKYAQGTLADVPILLSFTIDGLKEKTGPYDKDIAILDGLWRYSPFYRNGKLYPVKTKNWVKEGKIHWMAEYPEYIDNEGKLNKGA